MGKSSSAASSASSSAAAADDNKHAQKLQAVLLADAFSDAWRPVTDEPCPPPTCTGDAASGDGGDAGDDGVNNGSVNGGGACDGVEGAGWEASKGHERPLALCPLNNVPLLHHALDLLQGSGVEELFLVCSAGGDALEEWLRSGAGGAHGGAHGGTPGGGGRGGGAEGGGSRIVWSSKLTVTLLRFADCTNAGDALRELDRRALIKSDPFVLMQGDVVSNVDLRGAMAAHKARRKKDHAAIMTVLLQEAGGWGLDDDAAWESEEGEEGEGMECNPNSPSDGPTASVARAHHQLPQLRAADDDLLLALDPTHEHRILLWDAHPHHARTALPSVFFHENSATIALTRNCLDVGIDICSPDVLARFSDEFDYRHLRSQFVSNCAAEEEAGLQSRIYAHFLSRGEYAGRVGDPRRYHTASMDLLRRWGYPLVPDNGGAGARGAGGEGLGSYVCERHYVYRDAASRSQVGRSTRLLGPLLLGPHTAIGERCTLQRTVLGPNCRIGDGCSVVDSHLWGHAVVEDGAQLTGAILCEGAVVRKGAVLERGCVVGRGCVIGAGVRVTECTRITGVPEREDDDDYSGFDDSESESGEEESTEGEDSEGAGSCEKVATAVSGAPSLPTAPQAVDAVTEHEIVGKDGRGRAYTPSPSGDCDSDDESEAAEAHAAAVERMRGQSIGCDLTAMLRKRMQLQREDEDDGFSLDRTDGADGDLAMEGDDWAADAGTAMADSNAHLDDDGMQIAGRQRGVDVVRELRDICLEHEASSPVENLRIELNSFKFSQNATYADCCRGATLAVMERIAGAEGGGNNGEAAMTPGKLVAKLKAALEYWGPLFRSLCRGTEEERAVVGALESLAVGSMAEVLGKEPAFRFALQTLHDEEVVNEGAIREWAAERRAGDREGPVGALFWQKPTQDFLEWLEDDDSSSEEGSSSDNDDDSD